MIFRQKLFLLITLVLGFSLRFIYLQEWFHFEFDEEVIAWKLRSFLQEGKPFLIGGGTPFGFHLGPVFYYLSAIPLFFSRFDPIGWGLAAAIFGTATIWLMWLAGKSLFNSRIGLIAALLWATSFTAVMTDRHWWPLVLDPMLSLIVILCLYKILNQLYMSSRAKRGDLVSSGIAASQAPRNDGRGWWVILGFTLAFAWQADLTVLPLFLAAVVVAIRKWKSQKRGITIAVLILSISVSPLVLFELRHPGANLGKFMQMPNLYGLQRLDLNTLWFIPQSLSRLLFPITNLDGDLLRFYTWCKEIADVRVNNQPWWAVGLTIFLLSIPFFSGKFILQSGILLRRTKFYNPADRVLRILLLSGIAGIAIFRLKGGNLYDFYLAALYPVVMLSAARAVDFIRGKFGKITAIAGLVIIVGLNLAVIARANHPQGLAVKHQAVAWAISNVGKEEFGLESISNCSRYNGVRFLFWLAGKEPQLSFVDPELAWLYDKKSDYMKPKFLVTFTTPNDSTPDQKEKYNQLKQQAVNSGIFSSDLEVIISPYD